MELEDSAMARRATEELLSGENPPTAVFAAQNLITIGAVAALRGRRLQHAVALAGDDGPSRAVVLPTTLIARGSGEIAPEVVA